MNIKQVFLMVLVAGLAGSTGWFLARNPKPQPGKPERRIQYYQSAMHPWIKSDKPGKCTICGMDLTPVYEGDPGLGGMDGTVVLNTTSVEAAGVAGSEVRRQPIIRTLRLAGIINNDESRRRVISAYVDGRIERLHVNYSGAEVKRGEPLVMLYSPALQTAEREYVALAKQHPTDGILRDERSGLAASAALRLKQLGLTDEQIRVLPEKAESNLFSEILAPMDGTVVTRGVYEGQYVKEGDRLFEIADFDIMWLQLDVYEKDLYWIRAGQEVEVRTPASPGRVFPAKITFIDPNLNELTRSAKVRVEIPNPMVDGSEGRGRALFHRAYAEASVRASIPDVLAVPRSAVLAPGTSPVLYVQKEAGVYEPRRVKLGRVGDDFWEVLEGVSEGEQVVTSGNLLIDAQAQLNSGSGSATAESPEPVHDSGAGPLPAPDTGQTEAIRGLLTAFDAASRALADDNLERYRENSPGLWNALRRLGSVFGPDSEWRRRMPGIQPPGPSDSLRTLEDARKEFHELGSGVVKFSSLLRRQVPEFSGIKIYECPMIRSAFPGAPAKGRWVQLEGPLRNPYFGADMPDCGTEVKP